MSELERNARREKTLASAMMVSSVVSFLIGLTCFVCAIVVFYAGAHVDGDGRIARLALGMCFLIFGWLMMDFSSARSDRALTHQRRVVELLKEMVDDEERDQ